jgi:hypothetical protein
MMPSRKLIPYSVAEFLDDIEQRFQFLVEDYGFIEASSGWTNHDRSSFGFGEHVASAVPEVTYTAPLRHVSIRHDRSGALRVLVTSMFPVLRTASVVDIAREAGATNPTSFREEYDMGATTAGDRISKLAEGLRAFGSEWLTEPTPP